MLRAFGKHLPLVQCLFVPHCELIEQSTPALAVLHVPEGGGGDGDLQVESLLALRVHCDGSWAAPEAFVTHAS